MIRPAIAILPMTFLALVCSGCGAAGPHRDFAEVTGTITYNGDPVSTGQIIFQPSAGAPVAAAIQGDGTYKLSSVIGPNTVMIISREEPESTSAEDGQVPTAPKSLIPQKYSMPTSPLKMEVESGTNLADFTLE